MRVIFITNHHIMVNFSTKRPLSISTKVFDESMIDECVFVISNIFPQRNRIWGLERNTDCNKALFILRHHQGSRVVLLSNNQISVKVKKYDYRRLCLISWHQSSKKAHNSCLQDTGPSYAYLIPVRKGTGCLVHRNTSDRNWTGYKARCWVEMCFDYLTFEAEWRIYASLD